MKGKRIDLIELTQAYNKFRMEHLNKTYTREELVNALKGIGMNRITATMLIARYIPSERVGKGKLYSFNTDPLYKADMAKIYKEVNESTQKYRGKKKKETKILSSEEAAIELLQSQGYQVRKVVGFDMERFQKENPVLYRRYLKYELV